MTAVVDAPPLLPPVPTVEALPGFLSDLASVDVSDIDPLLAMPGQRPVFDVLRLESRGKAATWDPVDAATAAAERGWVGVAASVKAAKYALTDWRSLYLEQWAATGYPDPGPSSFGPARVDGFSPDWVPIVPPEAFSRLPSAAVDWVPGFEPVPAALGPVAAHRWASHQTAVHATARKSGSTPALRRDAAGWARLTSELGPPAAVAAHKFAEQVTAVLDLADRAPAAPTPSSNRRTRTW